MKKMRGFTIVELLIVIVIISILATVIIVAYNGLQNRAKLSRIQADLKNVQKLVEMYKVVNGTYPATSTSLNVDWTTPTARTDSRCGVGSKNSDWVPGLTSALPQSDGTSKGVNGLSGCYVYVSDGTSYIISAWNMLPAPQTGTMYRRVGLREMSPSGSLFYICNHLTVGGKPSGTYDISLDYYKRSMTLSNITSSLCNETPPSGA